MSLCFVIKLHIYLNTVDEGDDEVAVPDGSGIGYKRIGTAIGKLSEYIVISASIDKSTQKDVLLLMGRRENNTWRKVRPK